MELEAIYVQEAGLGTKKCVPCRGGVPPLSQEEQAKLLPQLKDWRIVDGHHLEKTFTLPDFSTSLALVNKIAALAEQEGHHPDIHLSWGKVRLELWTHKINGLTESDFILAAKIDGLK